MRLPAKAGLRSHIAETLLLMRHTALEEWQIPLA